MASAVLALPGTLTAPPLDGSTACAALRLTLHPALDGPVTWVTGVLYTIPSLALFAFLLPYTGLTMQTAEIGLVSYTLLILIRNVVSGDLRSSHTKISKASSTTRGSWRTSGGR